MKVKVLAPLSLDGLDGDDNLEVAEGTCVRDLLERAGPAGRVLGLLPVMVNGRQAGRSHPLADGDIVIFVFPRAGG